jgi:translation initiation factor IF-2
MENKYNSMKENLLEDIEEAKENGNKAYLAKLEQQLEDVEASLAELNPEEDTRLPIIIKASDFGTVETLESTVQNIVDSNGENNFDVIKSEVGPISTGDVDLADTVGGVIVSMDSKPSDEVKKLAKAAEVDLLNYNIIYKLMEDLEELNENNNKSSQNLSVLGSANVEKIFDIKVNETSKCFNQFIHPYIFTPTLISLLTSF